MWVLEMSKSIEAVYDEVLDLKIPFDILGIKSGETLEFLFINANYGVKDFYIPNETVLSVTRPALVKNRHSSYNARANNSLEISPIAKI